MSHKSAGVVVQPDLPFRLTGSQSKTKRAIEINLERMIREAGINSCIFGTLTVGRHEGRRFIQTCDAADASKRINNLARRFLPSIFRRWVLVTERHRTGAIHFHIVAELRVRVDVRTGYEWDAVRSGDYSSASDELRAIWKVLRDELPAFGFGRAQVEPLKNADAAACYVAKYVEKNLFNRTPADHRKKLVRYGGWEQTHCRSNDIGWATPRATAWRNKARDLAALVGVECRSEVAAAFGARWAFKLTRVMHAVDDRSLPAFEWSFPERECARQIVARSASSQWMRRRERRNQRSPVAWRPRERPSVETASML